MKHKPAPATPEIRTSKFAVRVKTTAQGQRKIVGYAAKFAPVRTEDLGGFVEQLSSVAFNSTLQRGDDTRALFNHDPNFVLGRRSAGTLRLTVDNVGLRYEIDPPDTQAARDLLVSLERGDISQSSYAFMVGADSWTEENGQLVRTITDISQLMDVSPVTYPATLDTSSSARNKVNLRSAPAHILEQIRATRAADEKTKTVDGEALTADAFIIVGNPDDPETWHLSWKFSTEEKTKAHLRDGLARFSELEGLSDEVLKAVWKRLRELCKEHGITVSESNSARMSPYNPFGKTNYLDDDDDDDSDDVGSDGDDTQDDPDDPCGCECQACQVDRRCEECSAPSCEWDGCVDCPVQIREAHVELLMRRLR